MIGQIKKCDNFGTDNEDKFNSSSRISGESSRDWFRRGSTKDSESGWDSKGFRFRKILNCAVNASNFLLDWLKSSKVNYEVSYFKLRMPFHSVDTSAYLTSRF